MGGGGGSGIDGLVAAVASGGPVYSGGQLEPRLAAPDGGDDLNSCNGSSTIVLDDVKW